MIKFYDFIGDDIIYCYNKRKLLEEINNRMETYKKLYTDKTIYFYCIKGIYYLAIR